jgi:hypothetical protein
LADHRFVTVIQVDALLLRGAFADTVLRPGAMLGGKVLERNGAHGLLLLAGVPLVAQLPEGVAAGQRLKLRVQEATVERLTLQVVPDAPQASSATASQAAAPPPGAYALALPGGAVARVAVQEREAGGGGARGGAGAAVALRYESPALGRLDLRIDAAACAIHVAAGQPAAVVRAGVEDLRVALSQAMGRPMQVTVHPREETFDVRA